VIALSLGFGLELALSLVVAIVLAAVVHRMSPRTLGGVLRRSLSPGTALLVFSIMIFKQIVLASVPFVMGLFTGLTISMVGIGFPLLLPFISGSEVYLNYAVLAFGAGFIGVLLSPMHLCLALTREYFHAKWAGLYRLLLPSTAVVGVAAAVAWFIA
jgi:hypothetical protein